MTKWKALLTSRKFWVSFLGVVASVGLLEFSEVEQAKIVEAILIVIAALGYTTSVAVEDGMTRIAESQRISRIADVLREYNTKKEDRQR